MYVSIIQHPTTHISEKEDDATQSQIQRINSSTAIIVPPAPQIRAKQRAIGMCRSRRPRPVLHLFD